MAPAVLILGDSSEGMADSPMASVPKPWKVSGRGAGANVWRECATGQFVAALIYPSSVTMLNNQVVAPTGL